MEETILISYLNDYIFCPASIYFHQLYGNMERTLYQRTEQINGTDAHKTIDTHTYSSRKTILQGIDVFTEKYGITGKIDIFNVEKKELVERKNKIVEIYDGYIFQLYAQYFALVEMGYEVERIKLYSMKDNKSYDIKLPEQNQEMKDKFEKLIYDIRKFNMEEYVPSNKKKCENCIYEPACDRSLLC